MSVRSPTNTKPPATVRMAWRARRAGAVPEDPRRRFAAAIPLALALLAAACAPTILPMKPGTSFRACPECPEMVVVPAGSFMMGASGSEAEAMTGGGHHVQGERERPRHAVTMDRPFALGTFKVTRGDYAAFVDETRYGDIEACYRWNGRRLALAIGTDWRDPGFVQTDRDPVVCVSWHDARAYAYWLGRKTGKRYRLLSEAEWEYVARSDTMTTADASPRPNGFGVHEMFGGVGEWLRDCWHDTYDGAPGDGSVWKAEGRCDDRVLRGGSPYSGPQPFGPSSRDRFKPFLRNVDIGFRVARTLDP